MSPPTAQMRNTTTGGTTSAENLVKHAHQLLTNCGIPMSPSKVSRLARQYKHRVENNGFPFEAFLANTVQMTTQQRQQLLTDPATARVISYADPTGESAPRNVDSGKSGHKVKTSPGVAPRKAATIAVEDLVPDPAELEDILAMASVSDTEFEEVLAEAISEGDLSRTNVANKCRART